MSEIFDDDPAACDNYDGVKCMDCRLRVVHEQCAEDCPNCCPRPMVEYVWVPRAALRGLIKQAREDRKWRIQDAGRPPSESWGMSEAFEELVAALGVEDL